METVTLEYTALEEIPKIHTVLTETFHSGKLRPSAYRKSQLLHLAYLFKDNEESLCRALQKDLGRPVIDSSILEVTTIIGAAVFAINNLEKWMKPESAPFHPLFSVFKPALYKSAKGVALIISPFNYPFWCGISPLIGAIAAGCPAVLKLSELTPATSSLLAELFPKYLDSDAYRIVNGAIPETTKLLELRWDQIVFTGSIRTGKIVAAAAAKHLTPLVLELGGKCPVIVDGSSDLDYAARRILWGKVINAGQTCMAPDYVLVPKAMQDKLLASLKKAYDEFYPPQNGEPVPGETFATIVSDASFQRLQSTMERTKSTVFLGGESVASKKYIPLTIYRDVKTDDSLMEEENFGPVLPIVPVKYIEEAVSYIASGESPLVLYAFTRNSKVKKYIEQNTRSGSFVLNETVVNGGVEVLPFGGVGASGYGSHRGKASFDTFTHLRPSIDPPAWADLIMKLRFPPYDDRKAQIFRLLTRSFIPYPRPGTQAASSSLVRSKWLRYFGAALLVALAMKAAQILRSRRRLVI